MIEISFMNRGAVTEFFMEISYSPSVERIIDCREIVINNFILGVISIINLASFPYFHSKKKFSDWKGQRLTVAWFWGCIESRMPQVECSVADFQWAQ